MIEKLTDEQVALMETVKAEWLDRFFGTRKRIPRKKARELIEWLYEFSGFEMPMVIFLESPLGLQYAQNMLKGLDLSQVRSQVESQVRSQVWSQVRSQARLQVWSQVRSQVESEDLSFESFSSYGNIWDLDWISFYDFFERIGFDYNLEAYTKFKELTKCNIYDMIQMDKVCFVAQYPKDIERDEQNRLHSTTKPAILWRDGYKLWFLHGVALDKPLWTKIVKKKITAKEVFGLENIEQRMVALKTLGEEFLFENAKTELIDSRKGYELYGVDEVFSSRRFLLKYKDVGTDRIYYKFVPPEFAEPKNALYAIAKTFGLEDAEEWEQIQAHS